MVEINRDFQTVFVTYRDIADNNPTWAPRMIEDYLALKRDVGAVATETSLFITNTQGEVDNGKNRANINRIEAKIDALQQRFDTGKDKTRINTAQNEINKLRQLQSAW